MAFSDGLQGWWCPSLDTSGNGTTTLTDLSGNGNNGTLTNMDAATDWVADTDSGGVRALDLDGVDDLIVTANNTGAFSSGQSFSVAGWIKSTMSGGANSTSLIGDGYSPVENRPWWLLYLDGNGTAGLFLRNTSGVSKSALGGTFNDGAWHQITSAYDATAGTIETWIDGVSVATASGVPQDNYGSNAQDTVIGDVVSRSLDARLDNIALYDRLLTTDEVTQIYNGGRSLNLLGPPLLVQQSSHTAYIKEFYINELGGVVNQDTASISTIINSSKELRVMEDANVPNSSGNPTIKRYLELEVANGYSLKSINNNIIITST